MNKSKIKFGSIYDVSGDTPCVKKVRLRTDTQYLTEAEEDEPHIIKYVVLTGCGHSVRTDGGIRFWNTSSGARKHLKKIITERNDVRALYDFNRLMALYKESTSPFLCHCDTEFEWKWSYPNFKEQISNLAEQFLDTKPPGLNGVEVGYFSLFNCGANNIFLHRKVRERFLEWLIKKSK